jgi:hypothetical protein
VTNRRRSRRQFLSIGCVHEGGGTSGGAQPASSLSTRVRTWDRRWAGSRGGLALPRRALTTGVHLTFRAPPPAVCPARKGRADGLPSDPPALAGQRAAATKWGRRS